MFADGLFEELIGAEALQERVRALGAEITKDYQDVEGEIVLVAVLKGSVMFFADLARAIDLPIAMDFIGIASYGDSEKSTGVVQITSDLTSSIAGKHILVIEDIIDTGLTAEYLLNNLQTRDPASLKLCSLLFKPDRSKKSVAIDYIGFTVPNKFVVGYGLDAAQKYRNLPYIGYKQ